MNKIAFPIDIPAGATLTAYLRIGGPTLQMSPMALWQPAAYAEEQSRRLTVKALIIAASVVSVFFFSVLAWRSTGQPALLAVGLGDACFGMATFMLDGVATGWLPAGPELWQPRVFGIFLLLGLSLHIVFASAFLDLPKSAPRLARGMKVLAGLSLLSAALHCLFLNLRLLTLVPMLTLTAVMGTLIAVAAWRGIRNARMYVLAWGLLLMIVILRAAGGIFQATTIIQGNDLPLLGFLASALVLGYAMYRDVRLVRENVRGSHERLLAFQHNEQARLAAAVESRTRELREAKLQAEAAGQARLAFLSTVSHELRTPLHTIVGYAQLLRKGGRREADAKLTVIESSGLQLLYLIDQILEFIRGDNHAAVLQPGPVALGQLAGQLEHTGNLLAAGAGNRFVVQLADDLPAVVDVDEHRLVQVLTNLIGNACKYTANGVVTLRFEQLASVDDESVERNLHRLRFSVEDSGVGIAPEYQARIFEPFTRVPGSEHQPGVGLGLTIARQTVRAMGSDIELESEPGHGSRFHFDLSLRAVAEDEYLPVAAEPPRIVGHAGPQRSLLVVDDNTENRLFLHDLCGEWGFRVLTANDGAEALTVCQMADLNLACVLVDQFMPVMDGWGFLAAVRGNPAMANLPVILISAAEAERPEGFPSDVNFDNVLLKPIRHQELADYLQRRLHLEWLLDHADVRPSSGTTAETETPGHCYQLTGQQIADFKDMLALGRIVAIRHWAEQLAAVQPELGDFAAEVMRLVESVDLAGLARLLAQVEADAAKPAD